MPHYLVELYMPNAAWRIVSREVRSPVACEAVRCGCVVPCDTGCA